jgi:phosphopantothenoylcysteine decarboxylase/phosphopantothenate--cysteine ligase
VTELTDKSIVLGVTGGIAAYKAVSVASLLSQRGARVEVVLTESALRFVQPLTFSAVTRATVHTDAFAEWRDRFSGHVSLAANADLVIVAPATAATIARLALGLSDDLLGLVVLSTTAPVLLAPAMEEGMFRHPATQQHLATLAAHGTTLLGPEIGRLASGAVGLGRMAAPETIVARAEDMLSQDHGLLRHKKVVVTAGGTREPIDPVRFIGNRSSGRMGHAIAAAAAAEGAEVVLISSAQIPNSPPRCKLVQVETAGEMLAAVQTAVSDADVLVMAAAVADFRPEQAVAQKIKKEQGRDYLVLRLVRNPDILASVDRPGLVKIGFAAETEQLVANAKRKLAAKELAMIVANEATTTIGASDVTATILSADGSVESLPRMPKEQLASEIVRRIGAILPDRRCDES